MKKSMQESIALVIVCGLAFGLAALPTPATESGARGLPSGEDFGEGITLRQVTPLEDVLQHPERHSDRDILIRGRISDVCQKKGCWTILSSDAGHLRVDFKNYGFFIPTSSSGRQAYVEGRVKIARISEKDARHYAGESRSTEPSRIHRAGAQVALTARGVRILDTH